MKKKSTQMQRYVIEVEVPDDEHGPGEKGEYYVHWYAGLAPIPGSEKGEVAPLWSPYFEDAMKMSKIKAGVEYNGLGGADLACKVVPVEKARISESWATPKAPALEN